MKTGDVFSVNLDPTAGDEIKKKRPVVVLNQGHEKNLKLSIVVPITGWKKHWEENLAIEYEAFFLVLRQIVYFEKADATIYGEIIADLESKGQMVGKRNSTGLMDCKSTIAANPDFKAFCFQVDV